MGIVALSAFVADLCAYGRERLLRGRILSLVLLLWASVLVTDAPVKAGGGQTQLALIVLLTVTFRMWDDLADVARDRRLHPNRILVRMRAKDGFRHALRALAVATGVTLLFWPNPVAAPAYLLLCLCFGLLYSAAARSLLSRPARVQLVLLKYPAFMLIATLQPSVRLLPAAVVIYLMLTFEEWAGKGLARIWSGL